MRSDAPAPILIEEDSLKKFMETASILLLKVRWTPKKEIFAKGSVSKDEYRESTLSKDAAEELSVIKIAREIAKDLLLFPEAINHSLVTILPFL